MSQFQYQQTRGGWNAGLEYWVRCWPWARSWYEIHCSICLGEAGSFHAGAPFHSNWAAVPLLFIFLPETFTGLSTFSFFSLFLFCFHSLTLLLAINQNGNLMRLCLGVRPLSTIAIVQIIQFRIPAFLAEGVTGPI